MRAKGLGAAKGAASAENAPAGFEGPSKSMHGGFEG